jgi:protein-disulfide isomerase
MRRPILAFAAAAAALLAYPAGSGAAFAQAPVRADWRQTIVATPEGGVRMGNPAAAVKLVEYVSLTCPHCRHFAQSGAPALVDNYVRSGRVSFELRPFPLDPIAAIAAQLNRCAAPAHYFALNDAILGGQEQWFALLDALSPEQVQALNALSPADLRARIAAIAQLDTLAARHGIGAEQARACLADQAGADRVEAIRAAAESAGITGTPSFVINGRIAPNVHDWAALEPLLRGN